MDGVYLDQLAAAGPVLDFSPGRSHGAGGGAWWSSGVGGMLEAIRTKTPAAPVTVEGNAEDKIGVVQGMLVPSSFGVAFARNGSEGDPAGSRRGVHAPAFVAVYGGYNVFFGDIYNVARVAITPRLGLRQRALLTETSERRGLCTDLAIAAVSALKSRMPATSGGKRA